MSPVSLPLEGVRVLDMASLAAGPLAATYLGEFGADVVKLEPPGVGDALRGWGAQREGVGVMWKSVSRNKRSVTVDLRTPDGQDVARRLAAHADVVVANTRPATLRRWGLDHERLRAADPRLVMLHVTGYGLTGPKAERPGFGTVGEAMSGFAHLTGERGGPPTLPAFMLADGVASLTAAYAVMVALYERDARGGQGRLIDVNLVDPLARLLENALLTWEATGEVPARMGNRWDISAPRNTYRTADGRWIAMSGSAPTVALRVFRAIGRADLADDPDFADAQRRLARAGEVDAVVADWVARHTLDEAMAVFDDAQIAAGPVHTVADLVADEQMLAREVFRRVPDDEIGSLLVQAPVPRLSDVDARVDHLGPPLGAHTDEVLAEIGIDDAGRARLRERGAI